MMGKKLEEIYVAKLVSLLCCKPKVKEQFLAINLLPAKATAEDCVKIINLKIFLEQQFLDEL